MIYRFSHALLCVQKLIKVILMFISFTITSISISISLSLFLLKIYRISHALSMCYYLVKIILMFSFIFNLLLHYCLMYNVISRFYIRLNYFFYF
uniref:Uncharacterized protein n=1 Tax=Cannabis sativa TaxID=3483 RepID=A0A803RCI1_CANSA